MNMETGVLSFSRNGLNHGTPSDTSLSLALSLSLCSHARTRTGPAFVSMPVTQPLYMAVTLYHHDDQVQPRQIVQCWWPLSACLLGSGGVSSRLTSGSRAGDSVAKETQAADHHNRRGDRDAARRPYCR
jgi:hypothetical protein